MKKVLALFFLLCALNSFAQTTERPYVESQYESPYAEISIESVSTLDYYTFVVIEYITSRLYTDNMIAFSDRTSLSYSGRKVDIESWGYFDGEEIQEKEFNEIYSLRKDRRYRFVLTFPAIPAGTEVISITENVQNGFYFHGVHLSPSDIYQDDGSDPGYDEYDSFEPVGSGTCFALNQDGYLATCHHVIAGARKIRIRGVNGNFSKLYKARVVLTDERNDLSILKIVDDSFTSIPGIPYSVSSILSDVGENVFVLGYPLRAEMGDEIKLTNGLVSSSSGYQGDPTSYQISAAVQPGNSGGPLFDSDGNIIGVVNARLEVESAAYAVKSTYLKRLAASSDENINIPAMNRLKGKSLKDKVKEVKQFIYIIEVE